MNMRNLALVLVGGALLAGTGPALAQNLIDSNTTIHDSLCVGFDCITTENYGFDTVRLKENNLRIHFEDTSVSTFPAVDWRITVNSSSSGGLSFFSIDDATNARVPFLIEAGAPTNSLYVDSTGNVGFGTNNPVLDVSIRNSNTPSVRLEQDNSGGFTAQTWDVAGNEANFFIRDVTGGSLLSFRIRPGAPTSSLDIAANGNVGLGTGSPATKLHVQQNGPAIRLQNTGIGGGIWDIKNNSTTGRLTYSDDPTGLRVPFKFGVGSVDNLLRVGIVNTSTVDVGGNLHVNGNITATGTITPDYVFKPGYPLLSIDEHASLMWQNSHLPKVGAAQETADGKGLINLGQRSQGLLEELEVAHIYIEQLHKRLEALEAEQQVLKDTVEVLLQRQAAEDGKLYTSSK